MGSHNLRGACRNCVRGCTWTPLLGPFGGASDGATKRLRGAPKWVARAHLDTATGVFGGAPYGAGKCVRLVLRHVARAHLDTATGAFCRAPYGVTTRVRGVPKRVARTYVNAATVAVGEFHMGSASLGTSSEFGKIRAPPNFWIRVPAERARSKRTDARWRRIKSH